MLLLCQQTLQIKTAGWDQTPTAYPQDETPKPKKLVKQATALSSVWAWCGRQWMGTMQGRPKTLGYKQLTVWSCGHTRTIFCCPITIDSCNSCTHRKAKLCGMIVLNLACCQAHLGVFERSQSPGHAPEQWTRTARDRNWVSGIKKEFQPRSKNRWVWWFIPVMSVVRRQRQETAS